MEFGGVDIVVHSAGQAISKPIEKITENDWDLLQSVLVKGQFELAKQAVSIMRKQGLGGDFISIASKNGLVSRPNNVGILHKLTHGFQEIGSLFILTLHAICTQSLSLFIRP